ncbi:rhomboid family intramembrane serine protease [Lacticaseibacillus chiayiensis]|uniref:rhomboid family intramembrane serine protease n=1 Tax=Lacticaseibacillus chiayiensis TaxID=2100821 RepID=UPI003C78EA77
MLLKLKKANLLAIFFAAKGTLFICCMLLFFYWLFLILTNTFLIPSSNFVGNIPSILRGELWYIVTGSIYHAELNHLLMNILPIIILGPFIEWKIGGMALVTSFFVSSWIATLLFCFVFGRYIQTSFGIGLYIYTFNGASLSVYALFPLVVLAFFIKKPAFSLISKIILFGVFWYFIFGLVPNASASDVEIMTQIAHLCGFLAGLLCTFIILILRNWRKIPFFRPKPIN